MHIQSVLVGLYLGHNPVDLEFYTNARSVEITSMDGYRKAIRAHASLKIGQSLYAGPNYESLARYLDPPSRPPSIHRDTISRVSDAEDLVTLHDLNASKNDKEGGRQIGKVEDLVAILEHARNSTSPALVLFMHGYLSPEWILAVGWLCNVDPEFWLRHFDFRAPLTEPTYFTTPALPSSAGNIIRLRIPSIGRRTVVGSIGQSGIEHLRDRSSMEMEQYASNIRDAVGINTGDSIVRTFAVHDEANYSLEQDMSLCVNKFGNDGWVAVVWSDCGHDLSLGPPGPWSSPLLRAHSWQTSINPTVLHKPGIALKTQVLSQQVPKSQKFAQSAPALSTYYGRLHDQKLASQDALYALNDVFNFTAFATSQYLNMIEQKIVSEMSQNRKPDSVEGSHEERHAWTLSNLLYSQNILNDHIRRLKENVSSLEGGSGTRWPRATEEKARSKANAATETLLIDYRYLLERAQTLSGMCDRGIDIAGNNAMITESRIALDQSRRVNKLTFLAFLFIPASFTTSLFGMNFSQFGQGDLSIWIWAVVLVPTYIVSIFVLYAEPKVVWEYMTGAGRRKNSDD